MIKQTAAALALLVAACSSNPSVLRITDAPPPDQPFEGIPMRLKTEQKVQLWRLDPDSDAYVKVLETRQILADQQRLYAVGVESGPFASPALRMTQYPDNTPKLVQVGSSSNVSGAIDATTGVVTGLTTARNTNYTACQTAQTAATVQDQAVATAQAAYDGLPATATSELRAAYKQILAQAKEAAQYYRDNPQC